ncbi:MAG: ATP-binding protein, partial [Psychrosphaera sp.]|nr:ATP-binding protein [Psychrosphaera sp.]
LNATAPSTTLPTTFPTKDGQGRVYGDQRKIRQILFNLAGNAVKFTDSGTVTLALTRTDEQNYHFSITDSGPGVAIDDQQRILQPFHQTEAGEEKGGTGLGLSICIRLLALMKSQLSIDSSTGEGSTFSFELMLPFEPQSGLPEQLAPLPVSTTNKTSSNTQHATQFTTTALVQIGDYANITIPSQLSEQLLNAAKLYQLSQIKPLLSQLSQLGDEYVELSKHLEKLVCAYRMDTVGEIIGQLATTD